MCDIDYGESLISVLSRHLGYRDWDGDRIDMWECLINHFVLSYRTLDKI